jgi:hypothetical protein
MSIPCNKPLTASNAVVMTSIARHRKEHGKKMVNQYEFQQRLGRGQHGEVFIARDTVSDVTVVRLPLFSPSARTVARVHRSCAKPAHVYRLSRQ